MKRNITIIIFLVSIQLMGQGNHKKWDQYQIAKIDTIQLISLRDSIYSPQFFRSFDSIQNVIDKTNIPKDFSKLIPQNFASMIITSFKNDTVEKYELNKRGGLPAQCSCILRNDSLMINLSYGFFSGFGNEVVLMGTKFSSSYFEYMDDMSMLKENLSDTVGHEFIRIPNKIQELKINKILKFEGGESITGKMFTTSPDFYEMNSSGITDKRRMKLVTTFKCSITKL